MKLGPGEPAGRRTEFRAPKVRLYGSRARYLNIIFPIRCGAERTQGCMGGSTGREDRLLAAGIPETAFLGNVPLGECEGGLGHTVPGSYLTPSGGTENGLGGSFNGPWLESTKCPKRHPRRPPANPTSRHTDDDGAVSCVMVVAHGIPQLAHPNPTRSPCSHDAWPLAAYFPECPRRPHAPLPPCFPLGCVHDSGECLRCRSTRRRS